MIPRARKGRPSGAFVLVQTVLVACLVRCSAAPSAPPMNPTDAIRQAAELTLQAEQTRRRGQPARAIPLVERALQIQEAALGPDHPDVATTLLQLAALRQATGAYERANLILRRALEIREAAFGPDHPDVAAALYALADGLRTTGEYVQAEALFRRALQLREAVLGADHIDVATTLDGLATLLRTTGDYGRAEALFRRALEIREAALGTDHPVVAQTLDDLALLQRDTAAYASAEALFRRALRIREAALGTAHPDVAATLHDLADLLRVTGAYDGAEPLYRRALQIREATYGPNHPEVASTLCGLADLLRATGAYDGAEPLYRRALQIREAAYGPNHPAVATTLGSLAGLLNATGAYDRAESLYRRTLLIREIALGPHHPEVALTLNDLAALLGATGAYDRAEPLLRRALQIQEAALDPAHPDVATTLNNLGDVLRATGAYDRAEPLYRRALRIQETALNPAHPELAASLGRLAALLDAVGRSEEALALWWRGVECAERTRRLFGAAATEARFATFLGTQAAGEHAALSLALARSQDVAARRLALTAVLLQKGRALAGAANASRAILRDLGPADRELFERLRALRTELATRTLAGPRSVTVDEHRRALTRLEQDIEQADQALAQRSAVLRAQREALDPRDIAARVAAALPGDGALVEFAVFRPRRFGAVRGQTGSDDPRYAALVARPDGAVGVVDLGPAAMIDGGARRLLEALTSPPPDGDDQAVTEAARDLDGRILAPLRPLLGESTHVFLAADGALHLVPFAALHDGQGYGLDRYTFTHLTSGRDLLRPREGAPGTMTVTVVADPDFETVAGPEGAPASESGLSGATVRRDAALSLDGLRPLPGTRGEAAAIRQVFPSARVLLGSAATESAFLSMSAPGILHVATHGVFLGVPSAATATARGLNVVGVSSATALVGPAPTSPLLRSALVLAGARALARRALDTLAPDRPDGLATALEVAGMDLWGTQLVVLSACDTGRGDIALGEGVYGLRRAVLLAGAETLVTSLWSVHDATTRDLMARFYGHLRRGAGRVEALREAMREVRRQRPHPYFWAPFILIGRGGPLAFDGEAPPTSAPEARSTGPRYRARRRPSAPRRPP